MVQIGTVAEEQPDQQTCTQQGGGKNKDEFEGGANVDGGHGGGGSGAQQGFEVRRDPIRRRFEKGGSLLGNGCNIQRKVLSVGKGEWEELIIDNEQLTIMVSLRDD